MSQMSLIEEAVKMVEVLINELVSKAQEEYYEECMKRTAKVVPKIVNDAINQFYFDYDPKVYKRTWGLYEGVNEGVDIKYNKDSLDITINSDKIPDHKDATGEQIFEDAYVGGIHGNKKIAVTIPPKMYYERDLQEAVEQIDEEVATKILKKYSLEKYSSR